MDLARCRRVNPVNGLTFSRKPRDQTVASWNHRCARLGGCNLVLRGKNP